MNNRYHKRKRDRSYYRHQARVGMYLADTVENVNRNSRGVQNGI